MSACLLFSFAGFGQQPPAKPAFEVASIKPSKPQPMGQMRIGMRADAGMLRYTGVSLKDCIGVAFRVKDYQIQGPDWIGAARFDIVAKLPDGSSEKQIPEMLQALLADRFKLALHRDNKEHAIYALVVAKGGPKLKPAENPTGDMAPRGELPPPPPPPEPGRGAAVAGGGPGRGPMPRGAMMIMMDPGGGAHLRASAVTLAGFADMISRFCERPVVDLTEIEGQYDFDLAFAPETMRSVRIGAGPMPPPGGEERPPAEAAAERPASIFDSVQRYGLKLDPRKAPLEILTVDHIEKEPTEN